MDRKNLTQPRKVHLESFLFVFATALLFVLPWKNVIVFSVDFGPLTSVTPAKILGVGLGALWLLYKLVDTRIKLTFPVILFLLFCLWTVLSSLWTKDLASTALRVQQYLTGTVFLLIIWDLNRNINRIDISSAALVTGGFVLVSLTLFNAIDQVINSAAGSGYGSRHSGGGYGGNNVANLIVLIIPFAWYLTGRIDEYFNENRLAQFARTILIGYVLLAGISVLLTGSRQGIGGYAVCVLALSWFTFCQHVDNGQMTRYAVLLITVVLSLITFALLPQFEPLRDQLNGMYPTLFSPIKRISRLPSLLANGDLNGRLPLWRQGFEEFLTNPIVGSGAGFLKVDNIFISTAANLGIIGFLLLIVPIIYLFRDNIRFMVSNKLNEHVLPFLFAWGFMAGLNVWGKDPVVWALFGLILSQTYVLSKSKGDNN